MHSRTLSKQGWLFLSSILALFLLLAACSSPAGGSVESLVTQQPSETHPPTPEPTTSPTATTTTVPDTPTLTLEPTLTPSATATTPPPTLTQVSRNVQTGIAQVDAVVEAMLSNDFDSRLALVRFVTSGCTTADGLGGPPKCRGGQTEGALVEYLPLGGPGEGSHALASEIDRYLDFDADTLYAAYLVSEEMPKNPEYPFGAFALIFTISGGNLEIESVVVRVDEDGDIVRLDFLGAMPLDFYFQQIAADLVETPPETIMFSSEAVKILVYPPE